MCFRKNEDFRPNSKPSLKLTHEGALLALDAALKKAEALGVPQNITVVDEGGTGAQDCEVARAGLAALGAQAL